MTDVVDPAVGVVRRLPRRDSRGTPGAATPPSASGNHEIHVVRLKDVRLLRGWHAPVAVVVDATRDGGPPLSVLAQVVLLRRRLRAAGGDLVIAANAEVADVLRRSGLHWAIPSHRDLSSALAELRR